MKFLKNRIAVKLRRDHITRGKKKDCANCPIALYLKEKFDTEYVQVYYVWAFIGVGNTRYKLSKAMKTWMTNFDEGKKEYNPNLMYMERSIL